MRQKFNRAEADEAAVVTVSVAVPLPPDAPGVAPLAPLVPGVPFVVTFIPISPQRGDGREPSALDVRPNAKRLSHEQHG